MAEHERQQTMPGMEEGELLEIHYEKSNSFRVVHADGVYGGMTNQRTLFVSIFSERNPIPKKTVHQIDETRRVVRERQDLRDGKSGVMREVEVGLVFSRDTAQSVGLWLLKKVQEFDETVQQLEEPDAGNQ